MRRHTDETAAFTLVEAIVVLVISMPLFYVLWSSLVTSRQQEGGTVAMGAAVRGAALLERRLQADLSSADLSAGTDVCTVAPDGSALIIKTALPGVDTLTKKGQVRYELHPYGSNPSVAAYAVHRDGRPIPQSVVHSFVATVENGEFCRWLAIEVDALDPGLTKSRSGKLYSHATTILLGYPYTPVSTTYIDYTLIPPQ